MILQIDYGYIVIIKIAMQALEIALVEMIGELLQELLLV
jgi:hypothetical protein